MTETKKNKSSRNIFFRMSLCTVTNKERGKHLAKLTVCLLLDGTRVKPQLGRRLKIKTMGKRRKAP